MTSCSFSSSFCSCRRPSLHPLWAPVLHAVSFLLLLTFLFCRLFLSPLSRNPPLLRLFVSVLLLTLPTSARQPFDASGALGPAIVFVSGSRPRCPLKKIPPSKFPENKKRMPWKNPLPQFHRNFGEPRGVAFAFVFPGFRFHFFKYLDQNPAFRGVCGPGVSSVVVVLWWVGRHLSLAEVVSRNLL